MKDLDSAAEEVHNRQEFVAFLEDLLEDLETNSDSWENPTLPRFLDAWSAWLGSVEQLYINLKKEGPPELSWAFLAEMLLVARQYE